MSKFKGIPEAEGPVSAFGVSGVSVAGFGDVRAPGCRGARISRCPCDRVSGYWGVHILGYLDAGVSVFLNLYVFGCSGSRGLEQSRIPDVTVSTHQDFRLPGCQSVKMSGSSDVSLSKCQDVQILMCPSVRVLVCPGVQMSECQAVSRWEGVWVSECQHFFWVGCPRVSECQSVRVSACQHV